MDRDEEFKRMLETMSGVHKGIAGQKGGDSVEQREWLPEDFLFAGQKVMLNPESPGYAERLEGTDGEPIGYVRFHKADDRDLKFILSNGKEVMPDWGVVIKFLNGKVRTYRHKDLLPINQTVTVERFVFNISDLFVEDGNKDDMAKVDSHVIEGGQRLLARMVYDDAWRKKKIAEAYERMANI